MRIATLVLLLFATSRIFCQEKIIGKVKSEVVNKLENPKKIVTKTIETINNIKNIDYVYKNEFTIPYMPAVFHEPFIARTVVSMNNADTVQGAAYKFYILEDTFKLNTIYDGKYLAKIDDNTQKANIADLNKNPLIAHSVIGSFHLRIKTLLENALRRNAELKIVAANDTIKIDIAFNNLQIEFGPKDIRVAKDTIGFISRYTVYVDRFTFIPIKEVRQMPYQTSKETILYQKLNFVDTLVISVANLKEENYLSEQHSFKSDSLFDNRLKGTMIENWKLKELGGDSIQFSDIKGKKCIIVFNSVGWRPCVQAIPFLNQLKNEYPKNDFELVSIEPFITNTNVLMEYKRKNEMNYPLLLADEATKKHYSISQVPVFMIIDKEGIIREIITGFTGKDSELKIRKSIDDL